MMRKTQPCTDENQSMPVKAIADAMALRYEPAWLE